MPHLSSSLSRIQNEVLSSPVYDRMRSLNDLRIFMQCHVFAVWSFMSLAKRLQRELTCVDLPWTPPEDSNVSRLINEIITGEESGKIEGIGCISHFELYHRAMTRMGANTIQIDRLISALKTKQPLDAVMRLIPEGPIRDFVTFDLELAMSGSLPAVAGSFLWGREDLVPKMFARMIPVLDSNGIDSQEFRIYVARHIELDGEHHGPMAESMLAVVCRDANDRAIATLAAEQALTRRAALWNHILSQQQQRSIP